MALKPLLVGDGVIVLSNGGRSHLFASLFFSLGNKKKSGARKNVTMRGVVVPGEDEPGIHFERPLLPQHFESADNVEGIPSWAPYWRLFKKRLFFLAEIYVVSFCFFLIFKKIFSL